MDVATAVLTHSRGLKERQKVLHLAQMEPIADLNDSEDENRNQISHTFEMDVADSTDPEDGREILHTVEMELADATESVDGKAVKEQLTILEMKTFQKNRLFVITVRLLGRNYRGRPTENHLCRGFYRGRAIKGCLHQGLSWN